MKRAVAAGALVFALAHLPFLPASLEDLDSINFAMGLRHFDVAHHQPHPPGYPLFIAAGKLVHVVVPSEAHALALLSIACGTLALMALFAVYRHVDPADSRAFLATLLVATCPLYWFTAARPLSDVTGLAAALAVQALVLSAATDRAIVVAGFAAAFAAGVRSQVVWLTAPLLVWQVARIATADRRGLAMRAFAAYLVGGLAWGIPLVLLSGGPASYWHALFSQGAEDLSGVRMLWTSPDLREFASALYYAFVAPWAVDWIAAVVLVAAAVGVVRLARARPAATVVLAVAFGPYLVFDVLFQETVTTRYSLPNVLPIAFLAVWGLGSFGLRAAAVATVLLAAFDAHVGGSSVAAFARAPAPAFRMIGDLEAIHAIAPAVRPVLAMHRREALDLRRPIAWTGDAMPPTAGQLPSPPKHEWLETVKYWNAGGRDLVWFFADPLRTDLALIDHGPRPNGSYRWPLPYPILLGGVRPDGMDWYAIQRPGWYLGEGWALTPETAGVAREDGRGPGVAPIQGWIRRRIEPLTLMIGGRNLAAGGPAVHARVALDGRVLDEATVAPGFFLKMLQVPAGALDGPGDYAAITVAADDPRFAVEQFDAQSSDRLLYGFDAGWQEQEYKPSTGLVWRWMSERASLRVHAMGRPLVLTLSGEPPSVYFSRPSHVRISAEGIVIAEADLFKTFSLSTTIPANLIRSEGTITIESDQMYVPAERSRRSPDRRHLALRVFECRLEPAS